MLTNIGNGKIYQRPPIHGFTSYKDYYNTLDLDNKNKYQSSERSLIKSIIRTTKNYCNETTLHGLKNISDSINEFQMATSRTEKLFLFIKLCFWIALFLICATFSVKLIYLAYMRYDSTPFITTIETTSYPIWNVPFPAVTVCNINKVYRPASENIRAKLINNGIDDAKIDKFLHSLDKLINPAFVETYFYRVFEILQSLNYTSESLMLELMEPCSYMMQNCSWLGKSKPCETMFRVTKSSEGFCCSFNYKGLKNSLEHYADSDTDVDMVEQKVSQKPVYRVSGAGINVGLSALVLIDPSEYVAYSKSFYGAYILIHGPKDFPQASVTTVLGQPGCDVSISVTPTVTVSQPRIRDVPIERRNCLFEDERKLRTSNRYSYQTCITECSVDTILEKCRCLPFFYPDLNTKTFSKTIRQCSLMDSKCLNENQHIFYSIQPKDFNTELGMTCDYCLPSCSEENYAIQTNIGRRYPEDKLQSTTYDAYNLSSFLTIKVSFKDIVCIKYRRDIYQTWDNVLSSIYGVFGLCLGGSVITILELVYYMTINFLSTYFGDVKLDEKNKKQQLFLNGKKSQKISVIDNDGAGYWAAASNNEK